MLRRAPLKRSDIAAALRRAGLTDGDIVHVQSDLRPIGPVARPVVETYLAAFNDVIGSTSTLTVCTAFEDYGRYGKPFSREESPSRMGAFSEHVRTLPGATRSIHPIVSVAGIGPRANEICGGAHYDGFGYDSPWAILHRVNAKLLVLGLPIRSGLSFIHYIEQLYGVPYQYTKLFQAPVYANGVELAGPFTMSVRYMDFGIAYDVSRFEERLLSRGFAVEVPIGRSILQVTTARDAVETGIDMLREDRYAFVVEPPRFRPGERPMDGPTGAIQGAVDLSTAT